MITDYEGVIHLDSGHRDPRTTSNTTSKFTSIPAHELKFSSDDYEVGLHEIQFPHTYWIILAKQSIIAVNKKEGLVGVERSFLPGCSTRSASSTPE